MLNPKMMDGHPVGRYRWTLARRMDWRVIGLVLACVVVGVMPLQAQRTYTVFKPQQEIQAQPGRQDSGTRVSLNLVDSTLEYAVREVARQAHMQVAYDKLHVTLSRRVTVQLSNMMVSNALAKIMQGSGLAAVVTPNGETIVVHELTGAALAGRSRSVGGMVTGRVTDSASGSGLGGAQVRIAGVKNLSTVTSDSGNFTLHDVPPGDQVLNVRLFGYRPAERAVTVVDSQRTTVRIVMVPVPTVLSGVVTTATGLQRKVAVGNDISTINVDSVMRVAPITSLTDLLETRVPGLTVQHSSGVPGAPSRIRVRGASSILENNDPILIVDGIRVYASQSDVRNTNLANNFGQQNFNHGDNSEKGNGYSAPSPLDQIDPNSIETVEVFKGPSASALYGSDAASGVIVITTKRGRTGPTHWSLALGQGVNWLPGDWPVHYYRFGYDALNSNLGPLCPWNDVSCHVDSLVAFQALNDPRFSVFSHGSDRTATLTISGGVPTVQYSLTGNTAGTFGNLKLPGIETQRYEKFYGPVPGWLVRPDNRQTWGVSGRLDVQPAPNARVMLMSILFNSHQQQGSLHDAITQLEANYYDASQLQLNRAPLIKNDVERATDEQLSSTNAVTLSWQPYAWLSLMATGGLNTIQRNDQTYIPYGVNSAGPGSGIEDTTGSFGFGRGTSEVKTLTVGTTIPSRWVNTAIGANLNQVSTADFSAYTNELAPGVSTPTDFSCLGTGCPIRQATSSASTYGWYLAPQLNFNSRFFVSPGFRLDGGSASGAHGGFQGAGLTAFPKIDLSYVAVDQSRPRGWLTLLRPRLAFGYAGTQPGPADKLRLFNSATSTAVISLNDSMTVPSVSLDALGNTQLQPERSHELEGGFDAELWHGRLSMTWTQYNKTRFNAILSIPVAPSAAGCGSQSDQCNIYINIGTVRNTGTELTANAKVFDSRALSWFVGGNISNTNSIVLRLNNGQETFRYGTNLIRVGYPLFARWERGIGSFADVNHNGIIEQGEVLYTDSLSYVGQQEPKYQINLNTGLTLLSGRLSVTATFAYQNGLTQFNEGAIGGDKHTGAIQLIANTPGTSFTTQAAMVAAGGCFNLYKSANTAIPCPNVSSIGLMQTVNTFRFNDLSINYTLPTAVSSRFRVPRMAIALQGSNLALHSNYRGKDPDVNAFSATGGSGDQTADLGQIPQPRTWWLKLTMGN